MPSSAKTSCLQGHEGCVLLPEALGSSVPVADGESERSVRPVGLVLIAPSRLGAFPTPSMVMLHRFAAPQFAAPRAIADSSTSRSRAFTLVELLVVIAIVALLIAVLLPVFSRVRANARTTSCLVNERGIALALSTYAQSNAGRLCSPRTDPGNAALTDSETGDVLVEADSTFHTWVNTSVEGGLETIDGVELETAESLRKGVLFPYLDDAEKAFRSPNDPTTRVRSYSLNSYVGNRFCPDDWDPGVQVPLPNGELLSTDALSKLQRPSQTLGVIVDESRVAGRDYNYQGWLIDWSTPTWIDTPGFWDGERVNISLMDGSTKTLAIFSDRFIAEAGEGGGYQEPDPAGAWAAMRAYLLPGRLE
jgi:prepilin-type N-terminal cleavage/methylation domain-containing protein